MANNISLFISALVFAINGPLWWVFASSEQGRVRGALRAGSAFCFLMVAVSVACMWLPD